MIILKLIIMILTLRSETLLFHNSEFETNCNHFFLFRNHMSFKNKFLLNNVKEKDSSFNIKAYLHNLKYC